MLEKPIVIGILNATPDSFFDGGRHKNLTELLLQAEKMLSEGAGMIDVGGFSSRPNCDSVSEPEERTRIIPIIESIKKHFPEAVISVDTFRSTTAKESIEAGATVINDISGGDIDENIWNIIADCQNVKYVVMHGVENMETIHRNIDEKADIVSVVHHFFEEKLLKSKQKGIEKERIILDPGFGFGKTIAQNYQLLHYLNTFAKMGDVMAGLSRKSMIWKILDETPQTALSGTIALNMIALLNGAAYLRVHDVKEAVETVRLFREYKAADYLKTK